MKEVRPFFSWIVLIHDFNANSIKFYDVLSSRESFVKKLKKQYETKEAFAEALRKDFLHQFWSRTEYEMILYIENNRVYLEPWTGKLLENRLDVTDEETLNWPAFAKELIEKRGRHSKETGRLYVKFDIYDQILFRFDELINFVWNYRHKYQRTKKGN